MELCEFLHDVVQPTTLGKTDSDKVVLHRSCRGIRCLKLGGATELSGKSVCKVSNLIRLKDGIEVIELQTKRDECCGFGGSYSVGEPSVSAAMGVDRLDLFLASGAQTVTATDMGCLAHLQGIIDQRGYSLRTKHIAEILLGEPA
jgi:L-lactate dehydrogenase complex protein LldE